MKIFLIILLIIASLIVALFVFAFLGKTYLIASGKMTKDEIDAIVKASIAEQREKEQQKRELKSTLKRLKKDAKKNIKWHQSSNSYPYPLNKYL